jgi:predicted lipid-binding transport protein (Tim44 family)
MKTFLVAMLTLFMAGATLLPEPAEAKRFGGGRTLGKQYSMPRQAQPPRQATQQNARQAQPGAAAAGQAGRSGASRWLGPLAGLAAGGLLASLFFGDAFDGFQIMDFLLIALLVFGGVMLFKMLRRGGAGARAPAPSAAMPYGRATAATGMPPMGGHAPAGSGIGEVHRAAVAGSSASTEVPDWFDGPGFVEGAKTHFIRLQAAWDRSDFRDIREYTSPGLFAELKRERESLGDAPNDTEVVSLNAELLGLRRDDDRVIASIRFTGLIREEATASANALDEIWHVEHAWNTASGDWIIVGVQQSGTA